MELTFSPWPPASSARGQTVSQGRTEPQILDFIVMRKLGDYPCLSRYRGEGQGQGQAQTRGRARPGDRISSQFRLSLMSPDEMLADWNQMTSPNARAPAIVERYQRDINVEQLTERKGEEIFFFIYGHLVLLLAYSQWGRLEWI